LGVLSALLGFAGAAFSSDGVDELSAGDPDEAGVESSVDLLASATGSPSPRYLAP
jgi:hypothetical protein